MKEHFNEKVENFESPVLLNEFGNLKRFNLSAFSKLDFELNYARHETMYSP
jgi:hypothetical protein